MYAISIRHTQAIEQHGQHTAACRVKLGYSELPEQIASVTLVAAARELQFLENLVNIQIGIDGKSAMINLDWNVINDIAAIYFYTSNRMFCQWRCLLAIWQICRCGWRKICPTTCRYILSLSHHRWSNFLQNRIDESRLLTICSPSCGIETNNYILKYTDTFFRVQLLQHSLLIQSSNCYRGKVAPHGNSRSNVVKGMDWWTRNSTIPVNKIIFMSWAGANTFRLTHMWCKSKHCINIHRCILENVLRLSN